MSLKPKTSLTFELNNEKLVDLIEKLQRWIIPNISDITINFASVCDEKVLKRFIDTSMPKYLKVFRFNWGNSKPIDL